MKDASTVFPDKIDDRMFYQDISIDKLSIMDRHRRMLALNAFTQASEYINSQDVSFYGAYVLNTFENRLVALEDYLVNTATKPVLAVYQDDEPESGDTGLCWT